jgi:hypothetical protein
MKRLICIAIVTVLASGVFASCKSHEKCPAYSKAEKTSKI